MIEERDPFLQYAKPPLIARSVNAWQHAVATLFTVAICSAFLTYIFVQPHEWTPAYKQYMANVAQRRAQRSYIQPPFTGQMFTKVSIWKEYTTYISILAIAAALAVYAIARRRTTSAG